MENYAYIIFFQMGFDDPELEVLLDARDEEGMVKYLAQWDYGEYHDLRRFPSAGSSDRTYRSGDYLLTYSSALGYVGLERVIPN